MTLAVPHAWGDWESPTAGWQAAGLWSGEVHHWAAAGLTVQIYLPWWPVHGCALPQHLPQRGSAEIWGGPERYLVDFPTCIFPATDSPISWLFKYNVYWFYSHKPHVICFRWARVKIKLNNYLLCVNLVSPLRVIFWRDSFSFTPKNGYNGCLRMNRHSQ